MTHADSLALPDANLAKPAFYQHVAEALAALLTPPTPDSLESNPITTLSNAASLLFGSYENYELNFGRDQGRRINWAVRRVLFRGRGGGGGLVGCGSWADG